MDINTIKHNDYFEVTVNGSYDLNDAIYAFSHVLKECHRTGLNKLLIDFRELGGAESATLKGLYAFGIEEQYLKYLDSGGHKLQIAYVAPIVTTFEPGKEIVEQRKLPFKLFDNLNEALNWLDVKV